MHFPWLLAAVVALDFTLLASAGVYFIEPASKSTCTAGSPCTIEWLDDGNSPLLNKVGVVTAGLYHGNQQLVQTIQPLDVAAIHSIQFTPNAQAGPDSSAYYIAFESTSAAVNSTKYTAFSPFFALKGMSGSFSSPLAAATSSISIPVSLTRTTSADTVGTTIVVGSSLDTSFPPLTTASATISFSPASSISNSPSASSASTSSSATKSTSPFISSSSSLSSRFTTSSIPTSYIPFSTSPSVVSNSVTSSPAPASSSPASSGASKSCWSSSFPIVAVLSLCLALSIS